MRPESRLVVLLALAIAGCGTDDAEPERAGTPPPPPPAMTLEPPLPQRLTLTLDDHGRTIRVRQSVPITLVLGSRYRWSHPDVVGAPLQVGAVLSDAPTDGQMWELRTDGVGRAQVRSRGSPACRQATPGCPRAERDYRVTLDVRP